MPFVGNLAHLGMLEPTEERPMGQLRIELVVTRPLDHARGHAGLLEPGHEVERFVAAP